MSKQQEWKGKWYLGNTAHGYYSWMIPRISYKKICTLIPRIYLFGIGMKESSTAKFLLIS